MNNVNELSVDELSKSLDENENSVNNFLLFSNRKNFSEHDFDWTQIRGIGKTKSDLIIKNGITKSIVEKLSINELVKSFDITTQLATTLKEYIYEIEFQDFIPATAYEILTKTNNTPNILFHVPVFDTFFAKAFRIGQITELYGPSGSGKSTLCHQLAITTQFPERLGGLRKKVMYIDTEKSFSAIRTKDIAENFLKTYQELRGEFTVDDFLINIHVLQIFDIDTLILTLIKLSQINLEEFGLVIIDSIINLIRPQRLNQVKKSRKIMDILTPLSKLAYDDKLLILLTNQISKNISLPSNMDQNKAVGGTYLEHFVHHRIYLNYDTNFGKGSRIARLVNSIEIENRMCYYQIFEGGIKELN